MDSLTGNLLDGGNTAIVNSNCSATLPVGDTCTITTARVIQAGDPNPVVNTVTVHYNPEGFPNDITDFASDSVPTVVPDITVTKTGDTLSKATDDITYTIEICNAGVLPVTRTSVVDARSVATSAAARCFARSRSVLVGELHLHGPGL